MSQHGQTQMPVSLYIIVLNTLCSKNQGELCNSPLSKCQEMSSEWMMAVKIMTTKMEMAITIKGE